jgi:ribosome-binding protein aMBF1 (putative translation factor)
LEKSEILKKVGKRIKEVRLQKGISQADLVGRMEGEY